MDIYCGTLFYFFLHIYSIKIFFGHDTVKVVILNWQYFIKSFIGGYYDSYKLMS